MKSKHILQINFLYYIVYYMLTCDVVWKNYTCAMYVGTVCVCSVFLVLTRIMWELFYRNSHLSVVDETKIWGTFLMNDISFVNKIFFTKESIKKPRKAVGEETWYLFF